MIENETIIIPGLKREYNFLHISDVHIAYATRDDNEADRKMAQEHVKKWSPIGVAPIDAFAEALKYTDEVCPDALFITGDAVDYIHDSNVKLLKEMLSEVHTPVHYVYGNHEAGSYVAKISDKRAYYPYYKDLMHGSPDFWCEDYGEFLVIGMDDSEKKITENQLAEFKKRSQRGLPIILTLHIPFYTDDIAAPVKKFWGENGDLQFTLGAANADDVTREFCELVKSPESNVAAVLAGHTHFKYKGEFAPGRIQYVAAPTFRQYMRKITVKSL